MLGNAIDITDVKKSEERLRKLNLLLSVVSEVNRLLSHSGFSPQSLRAMREKLEKLKLSVAIAVSFLGETFYELSPRLDASKVSRIVEECISSESTVRMEGLVALPIKVDRTYGALVFEGITDSEHIEILKALARDIGMAVRSAEVEEARKLALAAILDNLEQFDGARRQAQKSACGHRRVHRGQRSDRRFSGR